MPCFAPAALTLALMVAAGQASTAPSDPFRERQTLLEGQCRAGAQQSCVAYAETLERGATPETWRIIR